MSTKTKSKSTPKQLTINENVLYFSRRGIHRDPDHGGGIILSHGLFDKLLARAQWFADQGTAPHGPSQIGCGDDIGYNQDGTVEVSGQVFSRAQLKIIHRHSKAARRK